MLKVSKMHPLIIESRGKSPNPSGDFCLSTVETRIIAEPSEKLRVRSAPTTFNSQIAMQRCAIG